MLAKIFRPSKTAMQSGKAKTQNWVLEYEPSVAKTIDPLMGYTSSSDMRQQIRLTFDTKELAIDYAQRQKIPFRVVEEKVRTKPRQSYADNFRFERTTPWTH
ncbi:ETC complex I subunit [Rhodobacteraceae bacterium RKSG542]|uniref:ETC complex I subunit n=1 Tax=Pseudovibrio flavus TaxID=2529854 RepID=UPI0012BC7F07|nr:ETC complex I subunit [Pseudovibrio flavus]MTI17427.1 ETC complex I subunit [Pseudovibrio flavus]